MSHFKHLFMFVLLLRRTSYRVISYKDIYIYVYIRIGMYCVRTFGFKSCVYTVHIQICTSCKNKLQGPESKPVNQLGKFSLVEICCNEAIFAMKYCMESMNIKEKWNSILTGCATLKNGLLHVFVYSKAWTRGSHHFWLTGNFILFPSSTASSWRSSLHLKEIWNVYKDKQAVLLKKITQYQLRF